MFKPLIDFLRWVPDTAETLTDTVPERTVCEHCGSEIASAEQSNKDAENPD